MYTGITRTKESKSKVSMGKYFTEEFLVTKELRQGCCISPPLFKTYVTTFKKNKKKDWNGSN